MLFKKTRHPMTSLMYFGLVICFSIAINNPYFTLASFICSIVVNVQLKNVKAIKMFLFMIPFFAFLSILNPLVSSWGETVLFSLNGKIFTLESLCYGLNMGFILMVMMQWFCAMGEVLTVDKIIYLFGSVFKKVSLMMMMILRLVPFVSLRAKQISQARKAMGLNGGIKTFECVLSSTLEDGVVTAVSMENRGFLKGRRSCFIKYKFRLGDLIEIFAMVLAAVFVGYRMYLGGVKCEFYPVMQFGFDLEAMCSYCAMNLILTVGSVIRRV